MNHCMEYEIQKSIEELAWCNKEEKNVMLNEKAKEVHPAIHKIYALSKKSSQYNTMENLEPLKNKLQIHSGIMKH
jgi:hypothetical protein